MPSLRIVLAAIAACISFSAFAVASASADDFTAETYPLELTGSNTTANDKLVITSGFFNCKSTSYVGTISAATTTLSVTPAFSNCTFGGFPATAKTNGCQYIFNIGTGTTGEADLSCSGGSQITLEGVASGTPKCILHIGSQSDIAGTATYSNIGMGTTREIAFTLSLSGIDYSHTSGTGLGACPSGSGTGGTLDASGVLTGEHKGKTSHGGIFLS